jgi:hypothetical protein
MTFHNLQVPQQKTTAAHSVELVGFLLPHSNLEPSHEEAVREAWLVVENLIVIYRRM